jgi:hypothetical protein
MEMACKSFLFLSPIKESASKKKGGHKEPRNGAEAPFQWGFIDFPSVRRYDEIACLRPQKKGDSKAYKENS